MDVVNLSKLGFVQGVESVGRVWQVVCYFYKIYFFEKNSKLIYFTASESVAGNLKDLIIYAICWKRLERMVIHLHGGAGMRILLSEKHYVMRTLNTFFLKRVGAVIVLGERLKSIYFGVVPPERLHAVPNFANDEFFVSPELIDKKFSQTQPLRVLFLSNLLPGKGHVELLAALSLLSIKDRARLQVDFAGGFESAEDENRFRQQVQSIQAMHIYVHGVVQGEHKRLLLEKAHLFCLPTYYPYEGQPISILEAYASGCAVVTTDHSGIFDTFTPGVNGLEVLPRDPESIAIALTKALSYPEICHEFAKTNNLQANQKFRASTHLEALEKVIFSLTKKGSKI